MTEEVTAVDYSGGKILPVRIEDEMRESYIDYAMSVIVSRALPDVRDGLKPVHRRILYAMYELGLNPDKPFRKSARVVGEVLGKYHPHSDMAVYDAMVRMAQDFVSRYPLVEGHGNFGSVDGDSPAAMRYTEVRLSPLSMELLRDIDKETVDFDLNFDDSLEEPHVLPSRFPNLLVNGSSGIAVGMATNIPPHNLAEVIDGVNMMIDNPDVTWRELMMAIKGPDFPTGALILGRDGIRSAYETGRGIIKMRARAQIEVTDRGRSRIVITELPYQVNKAKLIEKIAELAREKKIEGISDLRDETDKTGMRIVVDLKRDANARVVLNRLFKYTPMQQTFGIIMLALVDGSPKVMGLREMIRHYLDHQKEVIVRRTRYELEKAEARAHILEGLRIALDNIDAVIALIRASKTVEEARQGLMERFGLTEKQASAILDMRLQKLTGLEREKVEEEYAELQKTIEYLRAVLASEQMVLKIIKRELEEIKERYGDERRTSIVAGEAELDVEDLIAEEDVVITMTHHGYVKRTPVNTYRSQRRGGRGVTGLQPRAEDFVEHLFITTTHHDILFFTNRGKVYRRKVYEIPEAGRQAKGTPVVNLIDIGPDEEVTAVIPIKHFDQKGFLCMGTRRGKVKRTTIEEFGTIRRAGIIALTLEEGDELIDVRLTAGEQEITLVTRQGMAIRFTEEQVRPMGRTAMGVAGIALDAGDEVICMDVVSEGTDLLVVSERGYGKRTPLSQYRLQRRGGKGVKAFRRTQKTGFLAGAAAVRVGEEVMLVSAGGVIIRLSVEGIPVQGRDTQGVTLMKVDEDDKVVAIARVAGREEDEGV